MSGTYHHRSGKLHQSNKTHKTPSGFSTKRSIAAAAHGRVEKPSGGGGGSSAASARGSVKSLSGLSASSKAASRANTAKQLKEARKAEALVAKRTGASAGAGYGPPKVVAIVGLGASASRAAAAASLLALADDAASPAGGEAFGSPLTLTFHTFRSRLTLLAPPRGGEASPPQPPPPGSPSPVPVVFHYDVTHTLAGAQAADVLLAVVDMAAALAGGGALTGSQADWEAAVDAEGDLLMSAVKAVGLPHVVGVVQGLDRLPASRVADARRWAHRLFATEFGADVKVVEAADHLTPAAPAGVMGAGARAAGTTGLAAAVSDGSALHLARALCAANPKQLTWRGNRPYLLVQGMQFTPAGGDDASATSSTGSLTVSGYLRGAPLNVHQLIHLPWAGAFQIESVAGPAQGGAAGGGSDPYRPPQAGGKFARKAFNDAAAASSSSALAAAASASSLHTFRPLTEALAAVITPVTAPGAAAAPGTAAVRVVAPLAAAAAGGSSGSISGAAPAGWETLAVPDDTYREPLDTLAAPGGDGDDGMDGGSDNEQTWPEENDEGGDDEDGTGGGSGGKRAGGARRSGWLSASAAEELDMEEADDEDDDDEDDEEGAGAWNKPLKEDPAEAAERRAAALAEAAEGRSKLKGRARRAALKRRGVDVGDAADDDSGDDGEEAAAAAAAGGDDDEMSVGEGEDTAASQATADAARAAMRGGAAPSSAGAGAGAASALGTASKTPLQVAAETDAQFPDEIDTPVGVPARVRFARYRGLKSFRSSPWDPNESLPPSYGHIFSLPRFGRLQRRVLAEAALAGRALRTLEGRAVAEAKAGTKAARAAAKGRAAEQRKAASAAVSVAGGSSVAAEPLDGDDGDEVDMAGGSDAGKQVVVASSSARGADDVDADDEDMAGSVTTGAVGASTYRSLADVLGPGWVAPGQYVAITLRGVPAAVVAGATLPGVPLSATGLLRHENRTSVAHFAVQRYAPYEEEAPLRGKAPLEVHCGLPGRVTDVRPLWSSSASSATSDRAKLERWLPGGGAWATATAFAPVTYGPMPVLLFRRIPLAADAVAPGTPLAPADGDAPAPHPALYTARPGSVDQRAACGVPCDPAVVPAGSVPPPRYRLQLVGWGSTAGCDPTRLVLKRTILSGFPVKVKNRSAVVKYMFFDPADVNWFAPVELYTKHGLVGSVKESLGTHGLLKARFDRVIKQHDTVCMPLYKRVFPRWGAGYAPLVRATPAEAAAAAFAAGPKDGGW